MRAPTTVLLLILLSAMTMACGGSADATSEPDPEPAQVTTGGEAPAEPLVLRTTTPVPVPQPAVAREQLPEPLQTLWTQTEQIISAGPPEPPTEGTTEAVAAWAADPFLPWVEGRRDTIQEAEPVIEALADDAIMLAVAAALFGYMYEDTAAGIRGAPVPEEIASDPELLEVYVDTLDEALRPFAQRALESYVYCATALARAGDEAWIDWARYCLERGQDVAAVFELGSDAPADSEDATGEPAPAASAAD